jgi:thiamine pyrophosphate-dependent acetolactate synthase large subunit-like protein
MPFYEVIYETGNHSIASYENDDEATQALTAHNDRAKSGQPGTPESTARPDVPDQSTQTWPAERIARVLVYNDHPATYNEAQVVTTQAVEEAVRASTDTETNTVNAMQAAASIREATSPFVPQEGPHDSSYAMEADHELNGNWSST